MRKNKTTASLWLEKAKDDILWAKDSFQAQHFAGVCFLSQQIAEKALKAYLFFKEVKLIRTHNLFRLLKKCKQFNSQFEQFVTAAKILNAYYIDTRYPDIWDMSRFEDEKLAKEALELAEKLVEFVEKKI